MKMLEIVEHTRNITSFADREKRMKERQLRKSYVSNSIEPYLEGNFSSSGERLSSEDVFKQIVLGELQPSEEMLDFLVDNLGRADLPGSHARSKAVLYSARSVMVDEPNRKIFDSLDTINGRITTAISFGDEEKIRTYQRIMELSWAFAVSSGLADSMRGEEFDLLTDHDELSGAISEINNFDSIITFVADHFYPDEEGEREGLDDMISTQDSKLVLRGGLWIKNKLKITGKFEIKHVSLTATEADNSETEQASEPPYDDQSIVQLCRASLLNAITQLSKDEPGFIPLTNTKLSTLLYYGNERDLHLLDKYSDLLIRSQEQ